MLGKYKKVSILILSICIFAASMSIFIHHLVPILQHPGSGSVRPDFDAFYYAFSSIWHPALHHGLYANSQERQWLATLSPTFYGYFVYPPQFAVLLSLFAAFHLAVAKQIWTLLMAALYFVGTWLIVNIAVPRNRGVQLLLLSLALWFQPMKSDLFWGQSNILIFFLIAVSFFIQYKKGDSFWSGVFLGLSIVFKITPIFLLLVYMLRLKWKTSLGSAVSIFVTTIYTIFVVGWHTSIGYVFTKLPYYTGLIKDYGSPWNSSFRGVLEEFIQHTHLTQAYVDHRVFVYDALVGTVIFFAITFLKGNMRLDMTVGTLAMLIFSPVVEIHHMVFTLVSIMIMLPLMLERIRMELRSPSTQRNAARLVSWIFDIVLLLASVVLITFLVPNSSHPLVYFWGLNILFLVVMRTYWRQDRYTQFATKIGSVISFGNKKCPRHKVEGIVLLFCCFYF